ncbi:MAG: NADAR family protein, partial [Actinobacteria bacterium]|nr:NADAR family protein [Actinomycetota bacterium]
LQMAHEVLNTDDPRMQKKLGRAVSNYNDNAWSAIADEIVYNGNNAKFTQNAVLHAALMATEGTTLVEASPYDRRWGIGLDADDPRAMDPSQWRGENRLGFVLTRLRDDLIKCALSH